MVCESAAFCRIFYSISIKMWKYKEKNAFALKAQKKIKHDFILNSIDEKLKRAKYMKRDARAIPLSG